MSNNSNIIATENGLVEKSTGRKIMSPADSKGLIKAFEIADIVTGEKTKLTIDSFYSILSINDRNYYFVRETGEFDGTSIDFTFPEVE